MRATLIYGAGDVRVEDVPDPKILKSTDAIVRVVRSCICGSDLWPYGSKPKADTGDRIGHEFLGVVEELGSDVSGLATGDLVVAPFVWADNTCDFCTEGLPDLLPPAASGARRTSTAGKARPSACPRLEARSSSCPPARTPPCCRRCC